VLTGEVQRRFKGALDDAEGARFTAQPLVYAGPIRSRPMGLWVGVGAESTPAPGSVWVVFCAGPGASAGALLDGLGEGCALGGPEAAADVALALQAEEAHATFAQALALLARDVAAEHTEYLAYLFERHAAALAALADWTPLFELIGDPRRNLSTRAVLVDRVDSALGARAASALQRGGLIRALVRAALLAPDAQAQGNVLARLTAWIDAPGAPGAAAVLRGKERSEAQAMFRALPASPTLASVGRWLGR
jgi:hypothetical protein